MRLLLRSSSGEFSLTKDLVGDDTIPPYAILSHTWGADAEEVTFEDLTNDTGKDKPGYEKIRFCGEQARQDDLQYFWVDTCCINKANYTELSQAINSMFRWYRNATRCYVYLSDVSSPAFDTNEAFNLRLWESDFRKSRWFERGWTLQELLAPSSVEFFSQERKQLGDKRSLKQKIQEITGITDSALQGTPLSQFSVDERLSWIERRQTKLEEDKAYSLLGIFDVHIPLIYGEGRGNALKRLREEIDKASKEVSGPILRLNSLEVNTEKLIGTGSNGTMVFEGKFDGRDVAVKRMLIQFFDIASQETKLLRESDDHPNVIRYFAQQQSAGFLYIALELCPASLADVIEKPHLHKELAQGGEKDLPNVLYQIANGLQHLHNLRIVHRDLKPQNILVSMGKDGRPRLLVSDFGLCKKLEGEQSSFWATTAHAAGTSGWRAPELLLDDDAKDGSATMDLSTHSSSGCVLVSADVIPNRRATCTIDIFSLGLVFFYVLTKGSHPFDCGDRYMREVNIRKGNFNLKPLEVLGDFTYEAKDLIGSMLHQDPKRRPSARDVMAHPFFWPAKKRLNFLCDVSDHFEKEKRDPPTLALQNLENYAPEVCHADFLKPLGKEFVESMGKQRKYTGTRLLDLLQALRNKRNHYEDVSDKLKKHVGPLPEGYLSFWTRKFPNLLITCWNVVFEVEWDDTDRFREYYEPAGL